MGLDYYKVLSIPRDADDADIKRAYRKLALRWHPDKNPNDREECLEKSNEIAEAYDVLIDAERRAVFDQYGEDILKNGIPDNSGTIRGGYRFANNTFDIFAKFFGTGNPFSQDLGQGKGEEFGLTDMSNFFGKAGLEVKPEKGKPGNINESVNCSLEDLYNGTQRSITISRRKLHTDGSTTFKEDKIHTVNIQPGWSNGMEILFPGEGDEAAGMLPGDLLFTIKEEKHDRFAREGNNLVYTANLSLLEALTNKTLTVATLDGRTLSISCDEVISPGYRKSVKGEGMPIAGGDSRGDLLVRFRINFPRYLEPERQAKLKQALTADISELESVDEAVKFHKEEKRKEEERLRAEQAE